MASYYGPASPNGANEGDSWHNAATDEVRVFHAGAWVPTNATTTTTDHAVATTTAATAGGARAVKLGSGTNGVVGIYFGSGAPTISAPQGSIYLRTDGSSTSTRGYFNTNGSTAWAAITTAS